MDHTSRIQLELSGGAGDRLFRSNDWQRSYTREDKNGEKNQLFGRLLLDW